MTLTPGKRLESAFAAILIASVRWQTDAAAGSIRVATSAAEIVLSHEDGTTTGR